MRYAILLLVALSLLGCQTVSKTSVEPKAEVVAATKAWETAANICDAPAIAALYADGAVLWGTTRTAMITTPQGIYDYFASSCKALPGIKVQFGDQAVRVYGDMAVNTGTYTWSFTREGVPRSLPARYSFTYVRQAGCWMIVDHHSSALPAAPAAPTAPAPKQ